MEKYIHDTKDKETEMTFTDLTFLFVFLPAALLLYYLAADKGKEWVLLMVSLFFYACGSIRYMVLLALSLALNTALGYGIGKLRDKKTVAVSFLVLGIVFQGGILAYYKYYDFAASILNRGVQASLEANHLALPLGLSFYTFKAISYLVDVYQGKTKGNAPLTAMVYLSFFGQIQSGPLSRYDTFARAKGGIKRELRAQGVIRFMTGFVKKIILANVLSNIVAEIFDATPELSTPLAWLGAVCFSLQLYYDFSGYSDMAIGLGKMFGFEFKENFNYPYISLSIREFWRRWHISLSSWFRDYVYIPLGGSRKGKLLTYKNLLVVFFLTGLWHGASWNFVFWGLFHGVFIIIERIGFDKFLNKHKVFAWIYTFFLANIGWVFFKLENIGDAFAHIRRMFQPWVDIQSTHVLREYVDFHAIFILICAVIGMGLIQKLGKTGLARKWKYSVPEIIFCAFLMILSLASLASNTYNPFIYFRF